MDSETGLYRTPLSQHDGIHQAPHHPQEAPIRSTSTSRPPKQHHPDPKSHFHHSAELLYDLFFLANLTVFTSIHTVNDIPTLKSYVSFFSLLWLTWYQISLYDARFSKNSIIERIFKALQLGAMMGFAACGPQFNNNDLKNEYGNLIGGDPYRGVSLVLMATRLILVCQYLMTIVFLRKEKASRIPLATLAAIYGFAAIVYFGLFWSFKLDSNVVGNYSWVGFYVIGAFETILVTMLSSLWSVLSPKGGQVIQRMGLLTLVVLGEGAIGIARQCGLILRSSALSFEGSVIGSIAAAVLALYCAYLIYFDWLREHFVGSWRQQIWLLLHFPLHLLLALAVEGFTWCITWRAAVVKQKWFYAQSEKWDKLFDGADTPEQELQSWHKFLDDFQQITLGIVNDTLTTARSPELAVDALTNKNETQVQMSIARNDSNTWDATGEAVSKLAVIDLNSLFTIAGFNKDPLNMTDDVEVMEQRVKYLVDINFRTTFIYTFVSVGLVIICCTLMAMLSKHKKNVLNWLRLALSLAIGIFLCMFVMLALGVPKDPNDVNTKLGNRYNQFIQSPWILPIIALSLLFVVFLNNTAPIVPKVEKRGRSSSSSSSSDEDLHGQSTTAYQPNQGNAEYRNGKLAAETSHAENEKIGGAPEHQHQHQLV
ncbi:hypothetical protein AC578_9778 [Pseudocercospora eumusae]|uniref:Uncharacterized protein n=1 Tax=Pseudocercospora eumusae TaxID=321146 RepID=A0A139H530_9PEZI|nr:hypothetical protein AC578_9778 [Pseudocercospora eumusae]